MRNMPLQSRLASHSLEEKTKALAQLGFNVKSESAPLEFWARETLDFLQSMGAREEFDPALQKAFNARGVGERPRMLVGVGRVDGLHRSKGALVSRRKRRRAGPDDVEASGVGAGIDAGDGVVA